MTLSGLDGESSTASSIAGNGDDLPFEVTTGGATIGQLVGVVLLEISGRCGRDSSGASSMVKVNSILFLISSVGVCARAIPGDAQAGAWAAELRRSSCSPSSSTSSYSSLISLPVIIMSFRSRDRPRLDPALIST